MELQMEDKNYGWTVEMQLKALRHNLSYIEIPVRYRNRIGVSKVSGTLKGSVMAGIKIIGWIFTKCHVHGIRSASRVRNHGLELVNGLR